MPAIRPAPGTSPSYMSHAASWPISRNGEPGSSSRSTRSRGRSLPRETCRSNTSNNAASEQKQDTGIGIDLSWMDKSVKPGDDFFSYADGSWVKNTPIPPDRPRIGGFWIADLQREKNTRELFKALLDANPTSG